MKHCRISNTLYKVYTNKNITPFTLIIWTDRYTKANTVNPNNTTPAGTQSSLIRVYSICHSITTFTTPHLCCCKMDVFTSFRTNMMIIQPYSFCLRTVKTQMKCCIVQHFIWVCTLCKDKTIFSDINTYFRNFDLQSLKTQNGLSHTYCINMF